MTSTILILCMLLLLLTVAVFIEFRQLCGEIRGLEENQESLKKSVLSADATSYDRFKRQQKDLGNLSSDFEQFKTEYGAALDYNKETFLVVQRAEVDRKAEEAEKAKQAEKEARVKAFTETVLDTLSKTLSDKKLTAEEASTRFEIELSFLVANYLGDTEVGIIIPDSAYLHVGGVSNGHLEDEHGRIIR